MGVLAAGLLTVGVVLALTGSRGAMVALAVSLDLLALGLLTLAVIMGWRFVVLLRELGRDRNRD